MHGRGAMVPRLLRCVVAWLTAGMGIVAPGCRKADRAATTQVVPLAFEFAGCAAVRRGPVCEVDRARPVRLFIPNTPMRTLSVRLDGVTVSAQTGELDGGTTVVVSVVGNARLLTIRSEGERIPAEGFLRIATRSEHPGLWKAEQLRREGKLDQASAELNGLIDDPSQQVRAGALRKMARIERARGRVAQAVDALDRAIAIEHKQGMISEEAEDRCALAFTHLYGARRFADARRALEGVAPLEASHPEGRVMASYYRGLLAYEAGDLRAALRAFRRTEHDALRLGMDAQRLDALPLLAEVLALLGRHDEAGAVATEAERLAPADMDACRKGSLLTNLCWIGLRAPADAGGTRAREQCSGQLAQALDLFGTACPHPQDRANVLTNLALLAFEEGKVTEAERYVTMAREATVEQDQRLEVWWIGLEAKIAAARGNHQRALAGFERLERIARSALLPEARLEAAVGRANALGALGRARQAQEAFRQAADILEEWSQFVPLGEGRETFLGRHEDLTRQHVAFLVERALRVPGAASQPRQAVFEAVRMIRAARARLVRLLRRIDALDGLDADKRARWESAVAAYRAARDVQTSRAAEDWRLPTNELVRVASLRMEDQERVRAALDEAISAVGSLAGGAAEAEPTALAPSEDTHVWLVYARLAQEWVGFAISRERARVHRLGDVDLNAAPAMLADKLLSPFADAISRATRIRVSAPGLMEGVDLHALPWNGEPLMVHRVVEFGLDIPNPRTPLPPGPHRALLIGDPRGDLASARHEAGEVDGLLRARGWTTTLLAGAQAEHRTVRSAMEQDNVTLLHYAGHGSFEGRDGWDSGFPLAGDAWLTVQDILALRRVPDIIVLSGCDTARTGSRTDTVGLGLAQAFIAMGARAVVAASRPVRDDVAAQLSRRITLHLATDPALDVSEALQAAQRDLWKARPDQDWAAFRALVP